MLNIKLRPVQSYDAESLVKYGNNPNIARFMRITFPSPYSISDANEFIESVKNREKMKVQAIEYDGELIGCIGLHLSDDIYRLNAEIGYWIGEPFWGLGIATAAVKSMVRFGFLTLPIDRIFGSVFGSNKSSRMVLEHCGFHFESYIKQNIIKDGKIEDEWIYAIRRKDIMGLI